MTGSRFLRGVVACASVAALAGSAIAARADSPTFQAAIFDTTGHNLGSAQFVGMDNGTQITIDVHGLPPGMHGMHIHEIGSCNPMRSTDDVVTPFGAAGGHFDPMGTMKHLGPNGGGHAGDLPELNVAADGTAKTTFVAKALMVSGPNSIVGRSIIIHADADNYTDTPPGGGSGGRIACGEIDASV